MKQNYDDTAVYRLGKDASFKEKNIYIKKETYEKHQIIIIR